MTSSLLGFLSFMDYFSVTQRNKGYKFVTCGENIAVIVSAQFVEQADVVDYYLLVMGLWVCVADYEKSQYGK